MKKIGIIFFSLLLPMSGCSNNGEIEVEEVIERIEYTEVEEIIKLLKDQLYIGKDYTEEQKREAYANRRLMERRITQTILEDGIEEEFKEAMREVPYDYEHWDLRFHGWRIVYVVEEYGENIGDGKKLAIAVEPLYYAGAMKVTDLNKERKETYYTTSTSEEIHLAIQEAAIIAQGPGTAGFDEALDSAWETALRNDKYRDEATEWRWKEAYVDSIDDYMLDFQEMSKMSTQEIAENYETYKGPLGIIEDKLKIID